MQSRTTIKRQYHIDKKSLENIDLTLYPINILKVLIMNIEGYS
jgi:hypothetical protein